MSKFARRILPLAIAAAIVPAFALAQKPEVYGTLHVSTDVLDADTGSDYDFNVSSNSSLIGVRSAHKLDDSLTFFWQVESTIPLLNGGALSADRDSFVGLRGDWGQVRVGQFDTPFKILRNRTDLFGNSLGDARNVVHANGGWDRRFKNSIEYATPKLADAIVAKLHYTNSPDANTASTEDSSDYAVSTSVEYGAKNFWAAVAYDTTGTAFNEQTAVRVSGYFDATSTLRVTALFQSTESAGTEATAFGVGARVKVSEKVAVKGQYYGYTVDTPADPKASLIALGAEYYYAKPLTFYGHVAVADNEGTAITAWNSARSNTTAGGESPTGISIGAIYRF